MNEDTELAGIIMPGATDDIEGVIVDQVAGIIVQEAGGEPETA